MHEQYFEQAREVATHAMCHRARCGAVIVKDGEVIGRGYNAPPLEDEAQRMCDRDDFDLTKKVKSDKTCCVHAEWNAILDGLARNGDKVQGSTLYFMRVDDEGNVTAAGEPYCTVCSRLALQSGVTLFGLWNEGPEMWDAKEYNLKSYAFFA